MGKGEDAPKGPDWKKLMEDLKPFIKKNSQLFDSAKGFIADAIPNGQAFVDRLNQFGMDAMGSLNTQADEFEQTVKDRVGALDQFGQQWGKGIADVYGKNQALADKVTGKLMPGMGESAELGGDLLQRYREMGIPLENDYVRQLQEWGGPAQQEAAAGRAVNDIGMASEAARAAEERKLAGYGIGPGVRSAALDARLQAQYAVAKAVAANTAREQKRAEGLQTMGMANDVMRGSANLGGDFIESASTQGRTIADIARQPGADWMNNLAQLGQYGQGVAGLEQSGGQIEAGMRNTAAGFGERGLQGAATQQNNVNQFGTGAYGALADINRTGAGILSSGYQTGGQLNANDINRVAENNKGGFMEELIGTAAPFVMDAVIPGSGRIFSAVTGAARGSGMFGGGGANTGTPASGTGLLNNLYNQRYSEGGVIPDEASPSMGRRRDDVPIMADAGEYVLDRDTVRWFGEKHFADLQKKAKQGLGIPETAVA